MYNELTVDWAIQYLKANPTLTHSHNQRGVVCFNCPFELYVKAIEIIEKALNRG